MDSLSATATASNIQMDYMKLLITELQNQNPLEPLDNNEMASQLAQFSSLQQLETMNSNFAQVLASAQRGYANSLIGKKVSYLLTDELTGLQQKKSDKVSEVYHDIGGETILMVGQRTIDLESIADSLIGKEVSFLAKSRYGTMEWMSGIVQQVQEKDGGTYLVVDHHMVSLEDAANSLIGKEISFLVETEMGNIERRNGIIDQVYKENGKTRLIVGYPLTLEDVVSVKE